MCSVTLSMRWRRGQRPSSSMCLMSVLCTSETIATRELNANQREIPVTATCKPQRSYQGHLHSFHHGCWGRGNLTAKLKNHLVWQTSVHNPLLLTPIAGIRVWVLVAFLCPVTGRMGVGTVKDSTLPSQLNKKH